MELDLPPSVHTCIWEDFVATWVWKRPGKMRTEEREEEGGGRTLVTGTEVGRLWEGPVWGEVYLEHKNVYGLTLRGGVYNLLAADSMWDRTVHSGRRTDPVDFIEHRDRQIGPIFSFAVRGKF
jgi:hypothetical protein